MENSAIQLTCGGLKEAVTSAATPNETSSFYTALEECNLSSLDGVALGDRSSAGSSMEQKSEYFSSRVEEMMHSKSQFSSDVEREIEHSRVHWSELNGFPNLSEDKDDGEDLDGQNQKVYNELVHDPNFGKFFLAWYPLKWKLGRKIAEGGQAEIFEILEEDTVNAELLFKVFKRGSKLSDLRKQWPGGILRHEVPCVVGFGTTLPDDGRFAFGMRKCWGDLRKLIDQAMEEKKNRGPPFPYEWNGHTLLARGVMTRIAVTMKNLHEKGIIHRDLKASNILLHIEGQVPRIIVADFECSIGVLGSGFWGAPEILLDLKNNGRPTIDFSEKMDVYSYGMTCFEVVSVCLPFEGELRACRASYDLVIKGQRPKLPSDLNVALKDLIERCWNPIPNERPSFSEIVEVLES